MVGFSMQGLQGVILGVISVSCGTLKKAMLATAGAMQLLSLGSLDPGVYM